MCHNYQDQAETVALGEFGGRIAVLLLIIYLQLKLSAKQAHTSMQPFQVQFRAFRVQTTSCSHALSHCADMALPQPPAASCSHAAGVRAWCSSPVLAEPSLQFKKAESHITSKGSSGIKGLRRRPTRPWQPASHLGGRWPSTIARYYK